ncbi:hypothetical protein HP439_04545 [Sphingobacterium shayense]|uniref:hypothetical protein n=1 Tax=Sphingobacterium shayense TaxID=626343 RepID=UPI0015521B7A|nr:hypothetical protein [Sphingobacterium shayense]NQD69990.1 hypothetical protein [Sphingobacterium shayense]
MLRELIGRPCNKYKIDYNDFRRLQQIAIEHLNVPNMTKLRDRFEGQKYLDAFLTKSFAELALEKLIGKKIISWEEKESKKGYKPIVTIGGATTELIIADFESYPLVPKGSYEIGVVVFVNIEIRNTLMLGYATREELITGVSDLNLSPMFRNEYLGHLKNFDILRPVEVLLEV